MRLKVTYHRNGASPCDVLITSDGTATVGDIADAIVRRDPAGSQAFVPGECTLVYNHGSADATSLERDVPVARCPLASGGSISVAAVSKHHAAVVPGRTLAHLLVTSGPDMGQRFELTKRASIVGRSHDSDIRLSDPLVSKSHARIVVDDQVEIIDLNSSNGVEVGGGAVPRAALRPTDRVLLGDTEITVTRVATVTPEPLSGPPAPFVRSPRVEPRFPGQQFSAPRAPRKPEANTRLPMASLLAPVLMGGVLFLITKSAVSIAFVALSPLMSLGTFFEGRSRARRTHQHNVETFHRELGELEARMDESLAEERQVRRTEQPAVAEVVASAGCLTPMLWARRPEHAPFGSVLLGHGIQPSRSGIDENRTHDGEQDLIDEIDRVAKRFESVHDVPITAALAECGNVGVCGPPEAATSMARGLLVHLVGLHAPAELQIVTFASSSTWSRWEWLQWLPHALTEPSPVSAPTMAAGESDALALVSALEDLVDQRLAGHEPASSALPLIMVVVDNDTPADRSRLVQLGERGPAVGVHLVWCAPTLATLPAVCRAYLDATTSAVRVGLVRDGRSWAVTDTVALGEQEAMGFARRLSPVVDSGARVHSMADVPASVPFLALVGERVAIEPAAVLERWNETFSLYPPDGSFMAAREHAGTLRALVGESELGPMALDLRGHGPHALVGGTTGAGKSEFLQSWVLGLASTYSPQRVTFLFVDYKGGAAFGECVRLPHCVGLVTDLTEQLVQRALASFDAELKYRERLLHEKDVKDVLTLEKSGDPDCPPSLVIVIDEFAALVQEVPDFVDGVVNVAQRGRSLGLHLIMATQRPAGVIRDNLKANTNLRVALRMSDESDSIDVVGTGLAAAFTASVPGRAIAKTGPGRVEIFQSAFAGGRTESANQSADVTVDQLFYGTPLRWTEPPSLDAVTAKGSTDVQRVVDTIVRAAAAVGLEAPRKPWLPTLESVVDLSHVPTRGLDSSLVIGMSDDPRNQTQAPAEFSPEQDGNMAVFGASGSGKTNLLRSLAFGAGVASSQGHPCHVYGLDFASRGLMPLEVLPNVGAVIEGDDHERVIRLIRWLDREVDERTKRFAAHRVSSLSEYRNTESGAAEPRILVLIDGVGTFREAFDTPALVAWYQRLCAVAALGRPLGVHVVAAADRPHALGSALASTMQSRVVLRMPTPDDLLVLGVPKGVLLPDSPPGRGFMNGLEVQVGVLGTEPTLSEQSRLLAQFAKRLEELGCLAAESIAGMPEVIRLADLPVQVNGEPAVGLGEQNLAPVGCPDVGTLIVAGPPGSGRTTSMITIASSAHRLHPDAELILVSRTRSSIHSALGWSKVAQSDEQVLDVIRDLASRVPSGAATDVILVVEEPAKLAESPALDAELQRICRNARASGVLVIAEAEYEQLRGGYGLAGALKTDRIAVALQPEYFTASTVFDVEFPRIDRAALPTGRAVLVARGRTTVVQIAVST